VRDAMNSEQLSRAATLTLVALCVGGAVTAYHLAIRPTLIVAMGAVFAISLISGASYLIVEAIGRRHLTLERRADARLASAIAGLHAGIALFDENDRLVVANPTYCQVHEPPWRRSLGGAGGRPGHRTDAARHQHAGDGRAYPAQ
jgi:PAS domain-containing protein